MPSVYTHVAGTDGVAQHGRNSDRHAAAAVLCARLPHAEYTSTAFVTLNVQERDCFDLSEVTHAMVAPARERTGRFGDMVLCSDHARKRESVLYDLTNVRM